MTSISLMYYEFNTLKKKKSNLATLKEKMFFYGFARKWTHFFSFHVHKERLKSTPKIESHTPYLPFGLVSRPMIRTYALYSNQY